MRDDQRKILADFISQMRWGEAVKVAQELAQTRPDDPTWPYWIGVARWRLEDPIGAIQALRSAERLGMDTASLHKLLGLAYYTINQFALFEKQMEKAIELDPLDYEPVYSLGRYHESIWNDYSTALRYFEKAERIKPDHSKSIYYEGYCQEMIGLNGQARSTFQRAIALVEKNHETFSMPYQAMARLLFPTDPEQALKFARKAVELEPNLDSNHSILGRVYERMGRLSDAAQERQAAVRLNPNKPSNHYVLFRLYRTLGQQDAAKTHLEIFRRLSATYGSQ